MDKKDVEKSLEARGFKKDGTVYKNYSMETGKYEATINEDCSIFLKYYFQKTGYKGDRMFTNVQEFERLWD
ncbi:MAG: hypothetical protein KGJ58_04110 [Patescibacteria group bacterium]|nr:hypothetical protein [Patescibacteria group bacterium]MDE2218606.1 hypothetical protein [Patescibacteria group bacterium]